MDEMFATMGNKTTKESTMDEQNELNELKRQMEEQQKKLAATMSSMEVKAAALQEKLDRRAELSSANAEAGVKKVALEYKVVELKIEHKLPPGFNCGFPKSKEPSSTPTFNFVPPPKSKDPRKNKDGSAFQFGAGPDILSQEYEDQAVIKECEEKARQKYREFEETKLKQLGEDGWTLRSIDTLHPPDPFTDEGYTNLYYFSRPL